MFSPRSQQKIHTSIQKEKELDRCIHEEHLRLRMTGAKQLSNHYTGLVQERLKSDASPRSVGALPASPTKGMQGELPREEIERRSPLDMKLNFLAHHASEKNTVHPYYRIETKPVPIPAEQKSGQEHAVEPVKLAYGVSALRTSFMDTLVKSHVVKPHVVKSHGDVDSVVSSDFHTSGMA
ncbi:MAG: hypothetical protein P1U39_02290 [Legionellaceae bacterium]|nr:hypothetical protein [Legionellaceae bacterium]